MLPISNLTSTSNATILFLVFSTFFENLYTTFKIIMVIILIIYIASIIRALFIGYKHLNSQMLNYVSLSDNNFFYGYLTNFIFFTKEITLNKIILFKQIILFIYKFIHLFCSKNLLTFNQFFYSIVEIFIQG